MEKVSLVLMLLGVAMFFVTAGLVVRAWNRRRETALKYSMLSVAGTALAAIFLLRYSVAWAAVNAELSGLENLEGNLGWLELISDCFVHTLQTFSMDEDYTAYLLAGKACFAAFGEGTVLLYSVTVSLLNMLAPVAGGAIIADILCDHFPKIRYMLHFSRTKYVFSELNEQSVTLAEDVFDTAKKRGEQVGIVFADTYPDDSSEMTSKLLERANAIGAFCVPNDVSTFVLATGISNLVSYTRNAIYLLMDPDSTVNLEALGKLLGGEKQSEAVRRAEKKGIEMAFLLFSDRAADGEIISQINDRHSKEKHAPVILMVESIHNAVLQLLSSRPLFLPLREGGYETLELLVVGSGLEAEELICQSYWCGQILRPGTAEKIPLVIHSVSETEEKMRNLEDRLRHRMPEAFSDRKDCREAAEFRFRFAKAESASFDRLLEENCKNVSNAFVCLENANDARDMTVTLQRHFALRELGRNQRVHLYCRFESEAVGRQMEETCEGARRKSHGNCHVYAFGSNRENFSYGTIFEEELTNYSIFINNKYHAIADKDTGEETFRKLISNSYDLRSCKALAAHSFYKLYSAGVLPAGSGDAITEKELETSIEAFNTLNQRSLDRVAWLEHVRWNAYTRSIGYSLPTDQQLWDLQSPDEGADFANKSMVLHLHNCLVTSDVDAGPICKEGFDAPAPDARWDELNCVSWKSHQMARKFYDRQKSGYFKSNGDGKKGIQLDYKKYDYDLCIALGRHIGTYLKKEVKVLSISELLRVGGQETSKIFSCCPVKCGTNCTENTKHLDCLDQTQKDTIV